MMREPRRPLNVSTQEVGDELMAELATAGVIASIGWDGEGFVVEIGAGMARTLADHLAEQRADPDDHPGFWHNVVAHPLLWLCPPVGWWLHARTRP